MSLFREQRSMGWSEDGDSPSPRYIDLEQATHLGPVFSAFRVIVDYVSTLPVDFYRKDGDRRVEVAPPVLYRNVDEATPGGFPNWLGQLTYGLISRGNAVGAVTPGAYGSDGKPQMVSWARTWSGDDHPWVRDAWWLDGFSRPDRLVAHVPWIVPPGHRFGLAPIERFAATVRAGLSAQEYADIKRGGGIPPAHLKNSEKTFDRDQARIFQTAAVADFASGRPWVTGKDWDLNVMTIPPNHAMFIETLKMTANQIASIFGIDPREVGGTTDSSQTYTNDESRPLNRAHNMRPYIVRAEAAVSAMLPANTYMKLNVDATVRADVKTRTDVIGAKLKDGRLSVNEARALDDLPPVDGGDFHNVPAPGKVPVEQKGAQP